MSTSRTTKPRLQTHLHREGDPRTRDTFRQLEEYLGLGVVMQTERGAHLPVRFNTLLQQVEVYRAGLWRGTGEGGVSGAGRTATRGPKSASAAAAPAVATWHNALPGLQGGVSPDQFYHLSQEEHEGTWRCKLLVQQENLDHCFAGIRITALTDACAAGLYLAHQTSGEMATGFGADQMFALTDQAGERRVGRFGMVYAGVPGAADYVWRTSTNGTEFTERMRLTTGGRLQVPTVVVTAATAPGAFLVQADATQYVEAWGDAEGNWLVGRSPVGAERDLFLFTDQGAQAIRFGVGAAGAGNVQVVLTDGALSPYADNDVDGGDATHYYKDWRAYRHLGKLGSVGAPAFAFGGDEHTGWWSPGGDTQAWSTGGTERMRLGSAGLSLSSLSAGRVPYVSTGGLLADDGQLLWEATSNYLTVSSGTSGYGALSTSMAGVRLQMGGVIGGSNYITPALMFTSADPEFTTSGTNPRVLAMIFGEARQTYNDDGDSAMGIGFATSPVDAGATAVPGQRWMINQDGDLRYYQATTLFASTAAGADTLSLTVAGSGYVGTFETPTGLVSRGGRVSVYGADHATYPGEIRTLTPTRARWYIGDTEKVRLTATGLGIGLGDTNPTVALEVVGQTLVTHDHNRALAAVTADAADQRQTALVVQHTRTSGTMGTSPNPFAVGMGWQLADTVYDELVATWAALYDGIGDHAGTPHVNARFALTAHPNTAAEVDLFTVSHESMLGAAGAAFSGLAAGGMVKATAASGTLALATAGTDYDTPHALLSSRHSDVTAAAVQRGDLVVGQGASPKWARLAKGAAGTVLSSNGTDAAWSATPTLTGLTLSGLTPTQVLYAGAGGLVSGDAGLTYDAANDSLTVAGKIGIGASPSAPLDVIGPSGAIASRMISVSGTSANRSSIHVLHKSTLTNGVGLGGGIAYGVQASDLAETYLWGTYASVTSTTGPVGKFSWVYDPNGAAEERASLDNAGNFVLDGALTATGATLSGLTAGRMVYAGTGGLLSEDASLLWDATNNQQEIYSGGAGYAALARTMGGLLLTAGGMNTTSKYTAALLFGSRDTEFTTENPKVLAGIVGRAVQTYNADTTGGMALDFATTPPNPGATSVPLVRWSITQGGTWQYWQEALLAASTADASDTYSLTLAGGGAAGTTRGSWISVYGADHASYPGQVRMTTGTIGGIKAQLSSALTNVARSSGWLLHTTSGVIADGFGSGMVWGWESTSGTPVSAYAAAALYAVRSGANDSAYMSLVMHPNDGSPAEVLRVTHEGAVLATSGTPSAPAFASMEDATSGMWLPLVGGQVAWSVSGTQMMRLTETGLGIGLGMTGVPSSVLEVAASGDQAIIGRAINAVNSTRLSAIQSGRELTAGEFASGFGGGYLFLLKGSHTDGGTPRSYDDLVAYIGAMWDSNSSHGGTWRTNSYLSLGFHPGSVDEFEALRVTHAGNLQVMGTAISINGTQVLTTRQAHVDTTTITNVTQAATAIRGLAAVLEAHGLMSDS